MTLMIRNPLQALYSFEISIGDTHINKSGSKVCFFIRCETCQLAIIFTLFKPGSLRCQQVIKVLLFLGLAAV
ncbi:hypothetical protein [Erwinia amylovora]|uniref:hypothetical protein n=1 Tax=Erwinia amylovora TaxID=552 RepID=UPI001443CADE|nr:hypothetical protein [Erwinia amylovora]